MAKLSELGVDFQHWCFACGQLNPGGLHLEFDVSRDRAEARYIATEAALGGLRGCERRMPARVRVFARMMVWRAVATERDSTCLAGPQMNPVGADLHALFAFAALRLFN